MCITSQKFQHMSIFYEYVQTAAAGWLTAEEATIVQHQLLLPLWKLLHNDFRQQVAMCLVLQRIDLELHQF